MSGAFRKSAGVTRMDVVCLLFAFSALAALGLPAAENAWDVSRRIQCSNNLKQIGLAVHNFHDTFAGLPPLAIGDGRASFLVANMPFMESQNIYNLFNGGNEGEDKTFMADQMTNSWARLSEKEKDAAASLKHLHCPSRRASRKIQMTSAKDVAYQGPVSDYCVVFIDCDLDPQSKPTGSPVATAPAVAEWRKHRDSCDAAQIALQKGAVRLATIDCAKDKEFKNWKPRDTFARITDGTAHTFIVGEKHLRASELRKSADDMNQQDGTFLYEADKGREFNIARNIRLPLGKGHTAFDKPGMGPDDDFGFGSQHDGGVLFLVCDGSVRIVKFDADPTVLNKLGHCQDGMYDEAAFNAAFAK